ncbi:unnamed protein product [Peniophora sp. CBMAI 1063]|nr:unnamed protein product [Peniophora sp. CBMAI 1063]
MVAPTLAGLSLCGTHTGLRGPALDTPYLTRLVTIIAVYADWGFTDSEGISGSRAGIVRIWNIVWFHPLDLFKFAMKATLVKWLHAHEYQAESAWSGLSTHALRSRFRAYALSVSP